MTSITISLSSNNTEESQTLDSVNLIDVHNITLDLQSIFSKTIPIFITIDWGNGIKKTYDNDLYSIPERENINIFNPNPLLTSNYNSTFYPSSTSLYCEYTIQVLIYYSNGEYSLFTIPISILTNDYYESIGDLSLLNVNLLPTSGNLKEYQLQTLINNQLIEFRGVS